MHLKGILITVAGVIILSPDSLLVKLINVDSSTLIFWRGLLLSIATFILIAIRYRSDTFLAICKVGVPGLICACLFAINSWLFIYSIRTVSSVVNTFVIMGVAPLIATLLGYIFLKERPEMRTIVAIVFVILGISLIFIADKAVLIATWGNAFALGMALCIAPNIVIVRASKTDLTPFFIIAGLLLALGAYPFAQPLSVAAEDILLLLVLGLIVVPGGFILIMLGPRYLAAGEVGLIMLLEAILGPIWVWLFLSEAPSKLVVFASVIVLLALLIDALLSLYPDMVKFRSDLNVLSK